MFFFRYTSGQLVLRTECLGAQRSHCSRQSAHVEDQQSTVRGPTVNSEVIDDQQSTVRGSTVNSEAINDQQSTVRGSMVNSEVIDNQHC